MHIDTRAQRGQRWFLLRTLTHSLPFQMHVRKKRKSSHAAAAGRERLEEDRKRPVYENQAVLLYLKKMSDLGRADRSRS